MQAFVYHRPTKLKDVASLLRKAQDTRLLAGGQSLLPVLKQRLAQPAALIDLRDLAELRGISVKDGALILGAMTRHAEVAASAEIGRALPALARLAAGIGDPQVRNLGTLGGSIANNDPAADYPAALLGLGATVHAGKRKIAADDFFTGLFETALEPSEVITAVSFPVPKRAAYVKSRQPASRFALVGVMLSQGPKGEARVAVTGAARSAFRVRDMEQALTRDFTPAALDGIQVPAAKLHSDMHASAEYRSHLITVLAKRAVQAALA